MTKNAFAHAMRARSKAPFMHSIERQEIGIVQASSSRCFGSSLRTSIDGCDGIDREASNVVAVENWFHLCGKIVEKMLH